MIQTARSKGITSARRLDCIFLQKRNSLRMPASKSSSLVNHCISLSEFSEYHTSKGNTSPALSHYPKTSRWEDADPKEPSTVSSMESPPPHSHLLSPSAEASSRLSFFTSVCSLPATAYSAVLIGNPCFLKEYSARRFTM